MTAPNEFERFAIVRLNGGAVPDGAVFHGLWPEVMELIFTRLVGEIFLL